MSSVASLPRKEISSDGFKLYKCLGVLLKEYRQFRDLSQEAFAESIRISVRELQNWEADRHRVGIENLHDLSEATGIPMQVCVALNAGQFIWYSPRDRRFAYSLMEIEHFESDELYRYRGHSDEEILIKNEQITTDMHIKLILSCHHDVYGKKSPVERQVIKKASMILPDLNRIIFDCWGHFMGYQVCLPVKKVVYQQLKKKKVFEDYLTTENISDIATLREGVFFFYSVFRASANLGYLLNKINAGCLAKIEPKNRYIVAVYSALKESTKMLIDLGMKIVFRDKKECDYAQLETVPTLYEIGLDVLMRPFTPFGTLGRMIDRYDKILGLIPRSDPLKLDDPLKLGGSLTANKDTRLRNHVFGGINNQNSQEVIEIQRPDKSRMFICPNPKCTFYGKAEEGNIILNGKYRTKEGACFRQFLCKKCNKSFCIRTGSIFYGLRSPDEKVLKALKLLAKGMPLRGVANNLGVKLDTVRRWLRIAAEQGGKYDALLIKELNVSQAELDSLWAFVKKNSLSKRALLWKGMYEVNR